VGNTEFAQKLHDGIEAAIQATEKSFNERLAQLPKCYAKDVAAKLADKCLEWAIPRRCDAFYGGEDCEKQAWAIFSKADEDNHVEGEELDYICYTVCEDHLVEFLHEEDDDD
jgi:hypothetical protein